MGNLRGVAIMDSLMEVIICHETVSLGIAVIQSIMAKEGLLIFMGSIIITIIPFYGDGLLNFIIVSYV